MELPMTLL